MFEQGRGVAQSDVEAARWFRKAADKGFAKAQYNLGNMFDQGRGLAQSDVEAARWYRKAADQGHVQALHKLGKMLAV
jgi:hypothetical protein